MRRGFIIAAWILGGLLGAVLLIAAALFAAGNTAGGRALIEQATARLTSDRVRLSGLGGSFPGDLTLAHLDIADGQGVWLTADRIALHWFPLELLGRRVHADRLRALRVDIARAPAYPSTGRSVSIPIIEVDQAAIEVLFLGAPLAGSAAKLAVHGQARLNSLEDASADITARRIDGDGEYRLHLHFDPARMDARLELHEPAGGPLENLLQFPGLGALAAHLSVEGPRAAERIDLSVSAGAMRARAAGQVDLLGRSADLDYSIESPALRPRADLAWQRVALSGNWHGPLTAPQASGRLEAWGVAAAGLRASAVSADLAASGGTLTVRARAAGLEIPGAQPKLLAQDPLNVEASVRLDDAARPLALSAAHRLFALEVRAVTAGAQRASIDLKVPDVAPFAAYLGEDVRGSGAIKAELVRRASDLGVSVDASAGITGGAAGWIPLLEGRLALKLSGTLSEERISVERLELRAPSLALQMDGSAARSRHPAAPGDIIEKLDTRWRLDISKLGLLSPQLAGALRASGRLSGPPAALTADASLASTLSVRGSPMGEVTGEVRARGIPASPSGSLKLHGILDGAPLDLDASLERGAGRALHVQVHAAEWKSAQLAGDVDVLLERMQESRGQMRLKVGELGDLDRVLGVNLAGSVDGSVEFMPGAGAAHARFQLIGRNLRVGSITGDLELNGQGSPDQLALDLALQLSDLYGAPASLAASAHLDLDAKELRVASASAHYRGEELRLMGPTKLPFAKGLSVDRVELGMRSAVLALDGDLWPALDVRAALRHVEPALVNAFVPNLLSAGAIEAQAQLTGRIDAPTGEVTLSARGLKSGSPDATGFPPIDVRADATLAADAASIDLRVSSAGSPLLSVNGAVPLGAQGNLDLKVGGKLEFALASAILEAHGMQASGQLTVNGQITGRPSDPTLHGTLALVNGKWRDYVHGLSLSDINAEVAGSGDTLRITSFKATAASGTVGMTGSIAPLAPGMPLDLAITAANAQPIASSLVTATLDADLHLRGTLRERIDITGSIHAKRTLIGIPDAFPPEVVVLDVRRRGQAAAAPVRPLAVGFDVTIHAPQEVLVQGRGLDAELGGDLHIGGTADAPLATGGFDLRRGRFSIAGSSLTFTTGRVTFGGAGLRGNIDPILDFSAQNSYNDTTAYLKITGYASAPIFEFSSTGSLPPDDCLAILLFGQPAAQLGPLQAAQIAAALSGTGDSLNPVSKIQKALGFDRLTVGSATTTSATGATQNTGAAIGAGRYLNKRVYVEAKQTTTGQSQVEVDVELTRRLKLQTKLGNGTAITQGTTPENDPGSSVGLTYTFEY